MHCCIESVTHHLSSSLRVRAGAVKDLSCSGCSVLLKSSPRYMWAADGTCMLANPE
uniref:Uncharacterized protein n=1 Tax=Hyaloperonospora arabidopsidis (strain Emoy2) TaxID=559515 RepID=M4B268_HYAAE